MVKRSTKSTTLPNVVTPNNGQLLFTIIFIKINKEIIRISLV